MKPVVRAEIVLFLIILFPYLEPVQFYPAAWRSLDPVLQATLSHSITLTLFLLVPEFRRAALNGLRAAPNNRTPVLRRLAIFALGLWLLFAFSVIVLDSIYHVLHQAWPDPGPLYFAQSLSKTSQVFHLTVGLLIIAIDEEFIYRVGIRHVLERRDVLPSVIVLVGAVLFGQTHLGISVNHAIVTAISGGVFMAIYLSTDSIRLLVASHYLTNVYYFGGDYGFW